MDEEEKIYEWVIPPDYPNFSGFDDLPEAYRVFKNQKASGGVIVEARYKGKWEANPWNTRTLIRHMVHEETRREKLREALKPFWNACHKHRKHFYADDEKIQETYDSNQISLKVGTQKEWRELYEALKNEDL